MLEKGLMIGALLGGSAAVAMPVSVLAQLDPAPAASASEDAPEAVDEGEAAPAAEAMTGEEPASTEAEAETEAPAEIGGLEEVIVTARKRSKAELSQDVPVSIAAVSGEQLENRQMTSLTQLAQNVPNVAMDDGGTIKGTANFSVRGLGLASSIPTLEPTTGTFVDGIYLASNQGVILDLFDLDGIEILRGPQGTLFGRNVTGGAVLIRTRAPSNTFEARMKAAVESGLETKIAGSVSGPLSETIAARLSVFYDKDDGYFTNDYDGSDFGKSETKLVRGSASWKPNNVFDTILRVEAGVLKGDGAASQNPAFQDRHDFRINQDYRGFTDLNWEQVTSESNINVAFGEGVITNVAGYRNVDDLSAVDADGTPILGFHDIFDVQVEQVSNELRYAGRFGDRVDVTTGVYLFHATISLLETRMLAPLGGAPRAFGGEQKHDAWAVFSQADVELTELLDLTVGGRYSSEKKSADIARFTAAASACDPNTGACNYSDRLSNTWHSFTPKIGLQYEISRDAQVYTSWSKAYRAGGYNIRVAGAAQNPEFDQESTSAFEIGGKADWLERRLRTNLAVFHNTIKDMIRDVQLPTPEGNIVTDTRNTADATIWGVEFEGEALVTDALRLTAFFGYQNGEYDTLRSSLTEENPPVVDGKDYGLELPRLAPWSYGAGAEHRAGLGEYSLTSRVNFSHRDQAFANDSNIATLNQLNMLDASFTLGLHQDKLKMTVYGRNLLDQAYQGQSILLPANVQPPITSGRRGAFNNLLEGRVFGLEWSYEF